MTTRSCLALSCAASVNPPRLFCPHHWRRLPHYLKRRVCDAYGPRIRVPLDVPAFFLAAAAARYWLAEQERCLSPVACAAAYGRCRAKAMLAAAAKAEKKRIR